MEIIYGKNPVKEAIAAGSRKLFEIMVSHENAEDITSLVRGVPVHTLPKQELEKISKTRFHQGVIAKVSRYRHASLNSLFDLPFVVLLDSVEDPQNLGSIIRTAYALAEAGIIIPENRAAGITPAVVKASAGATEHAKIAKVTNLRMAAKELKKQGFWVVGLDAGSTVPLSKIPLYDKIALLLGGEDTGIRTGMGKEADVLAYIPMKGTFNSLNVSNSAAIGMYELISRSGR